MSGESFDVSEPRVAVSADIVQLAHSAPIISCICPHQQSRSLTISIEMNGDERVSCTDAQCLANKPTWRRVTVSA